MGRIIVLLMTCFLFFCDPQETSNSKLNPAVGDDKTPFAEAQTVGISPPVENPIDHALSLVGLRGGDLSRPLSWEEGYHLIDRIPLIDHVAENPFYLRRWADDSSRLLNLHAQRGISNALGYLIETLNGGVSYDKKPNFAAGQFNSAEAYV